MNAVLKVAPAAISDLPPETAQSAPERLSVLILTFDTCRDPGRMVEVLRTSFEGTAAPAELILVGGPGTREKAATAAAAAGDWLEVVPVETSVAPDEDDALKLALGRATGDLILTLPGWRTPGAEALGNLFAAFEGHDFVAGTELDPAAVRRASWRRRLFHWTVGRLFGARFHDLFCRVRLGRREVFEETAVFGVRQHFVPVVATWRGFDVTEAHVPARVDAEAFGSHRAVSIAGHFRAMVDLMMLYVVLKFLHRPLRFFSLIGAPLTLAGLAITGWLVAARLLGLTSLGDRPAFTLGILFIVLGVQVIAIGLIGEIIVFTSKRRMKAYEVSEVTGGSTGSSTGGGVKSGDETARTRT